MQTTSDLISDHKWEIIATIIIGAFIIFIISFVVGIQDILDVLSKSNPLIILIALILEIVIIGAWTVRWSLILKVIDKSPRFNKLFVMMFTSLFGNNLTPGAAGGEPMRAYLLSKFEGISFDLAFVSASADRVFEFFPFVLVSGFAVYMISTWNIGFWSSLFISFLIIITMSFFGLLIYVGVKREIAERIILSIARSLFPFFIKLTKKELTFAQVTDQIIYYVDRFSTGFATVLQDHKMFTLGLAISFAMWGTDMLRMYLCFVAVGSFPPIIPMIIIYTIGILITILPTIPGALGLREATMVGLFLVVGVPADIVIAASLIDRIVSYLMPTIVGAFTTAYYGRLLKNSDSSSS
ncbi:flippase-like domain-containing protein [Methanobacterium spitsbergense]|uniref:Flippase-like domain-containing protein n=1 Tax=Methanobacterium spitsbergense TaxID=2874285 RepID=A0A8T5UPD1_9EURY|nr:flippase-like domain-containing protein [Methanobacterium spitsbergense]MBZ2165504.1 flippase-like domain-containing protein [Methanobacterium spitsbergense]